MSPPSLNLSFPTHPGLQGAELHHGRRLPLRVRRDARRRHRGFDPEMRGDARLRRRARVRRGDDALPGQPRRVRVGDGVLLRAGGRRLVRLPAPPLLERRRRPRFIMSEASQHRRFALLPRLAFGLELLHGVVQPLGQSLTSRLDVEGNRVHVHREAPPHIINSFSQAIDALLQFHASFINISLELGAHLLHLRVAPRLDTLRHLRALLHFIM